MSWNNRVDSNYREERPSTPIYALRKEGRIEEAYQLAQRLYQQDSDDDDINKAFSWVLIDLCKKFISEQNLIKAQTYFNQLSNIQFEYEDEFVATIKKQIHFLKPKIDTNYSEIQKAEELSKNGNNKEALAIIKDLISQNRLTELHHESYGWVIYRYIKSEEGNLSSVEVRTFLRDYMSLKNERPSMLHSMILNFALNYSKTHSDFKFYNFFLLWNPDNLRHEDLTDGYKDGKDIPSLISRICREFVNSNTELNIEEFLNKIELSKETVLDFLRETLFWNIFNAHKENKFSELWNLFEQYNVNYPKHGQSKWHSEILNLAERFMNENDEWRFLNFFKNWNPENLRPDDWKETKKDEHTYKPLATKAIKKAFEVLKTQTSEQNLSWLIQPYEKAIKLFPDDEWLLREKALLHFKNNELELAIKIYKQLVLELADKHYVWQEFSDCIDSDNSLKIGMLSKALSLEKNEDFLGDIHLDLAQALIDENLLENVLVELEEYKKHREIKGWKLSSLYDDLYKKASSVKQSLKDNQELYKKFIPFAENFAYAYFDWTEVVLADKWKDDKGKERLTFTDGKTIEFAIGRNRFEVLRQSELGQIFKFKLHKQEIKKEVEAKFAWFGKTVVKEYKYIPLIVEKSEKENWSILQIEYGFVEYVNTEKQILHIISNTSNELFPKYDKEFLKKGDYVSFRQYSKTIKDEKRIIPIQISKCDKQTAILNFKNRIVVVDDVNDSKKLFHFVLGKGLLTGISFFSDTEIRPEVGAFLRVFFSIKKDKTGKKKLVPMLFEKTDETDKALQKTISGELEIKDGGFAFVVDCYVSKKTLEQFCIVNDCFVSAKAVYTGEGDKWKVYEIEKI